MHDFHDIFLELINICFLHVEVSKIEKIVQRKSYKKILHKKRSKCITFLNVFSYKYNIFLKLKDTKKILTYRMISLYKISNLFRK